MQLVWYVEDREQQVQGSIRNRHRCSEGAGEGRKLVRKLRTVLGAPRGEDGNKLKVCFFWAPLILFLSLWLLRGNSGRPLDTKSREELLILLQISLLGKAKAPRETER